MPTKYLNWLLFCLYTLLSSGLGRFSFRRGRADPFCEGLARATRGASGDGYIDRAEVSQANNPPPVKEQ
jgi:hypothetical protein